MPPVSPNQETREREALPPLPSWLQCSPTGEILPYDYGMKGKTGTHEVKRLARFLPESLKQLEEAFGVGAVDPLVCAAQALDQLLPAAERRQLVPEGFSQGTLTLSLANRGNRFRYTRSLVPKLRTALRPKLGFVTIRLVDR